MCGRIYKVDINIPDDLWELIRDGRNLLCGMCIVEEIERLGQYDAYKLEVIMDLLNYQINNAPIMLRDYVHELESCSGNVALLIRDRFELKQQVQGLIEVVRRLKETKGG